MQKTIHQLPLFWLRNALVLGQLLIWVMDQYLWQSNYSDWVFVVVVVHLIVNLFLGLTKHTKKQRSIFIHLLIDVLLLSMFFYLAGGATNPFTWFLLIPLIFSTTLLQQKYTWYLTVVSIVCYSVLIKLYHPMAESMADHDMHSNVFNEHLMGMWMGFIVISLLIAFALVGFIEKLREKDQLLAKIKLKQAQDAKMLALATLATGSAHELGTPLATINIVTKELLNDKGLMDHHGALQIVSSQIRRCKDSLAKITASTGITQAINGTILSINKFIDQLNEQLVVPDNVRLRIQKHVKNDERILVDTTVVQSVVNLINNAIESQADLVEICFSNDDKMMSIIINDNGPGMPNKVSAQEQSDKEFGMGLGLFLAHATIERFNGSIDVNHSYQSGAQLIVKLPLEK